MVDSMRAKNEPNITFLRQLRYGAFDCTTHRVLVYTQVLQREKHTFRVGDETDLCRNADAGSHTGLRHTGR